MNHWLMKSEPETFGIEALAALPKKTTAWDGVRNYQARNFMRAMRMGDRVLFYHSNAEPPAIVGTAEVVRLAYPDATAWDPTDHHFDPKASADNPIWDMVDVQLEKIFAEPLSLDVLRAEPALNGMELLRKGSRLSVQPVSAEHFAVVLQLAKKPGGAAKAGNKRTARS